MYKGIDPAKVAKIKRKQAATGKKLKKPRITPASCKHKGRLLQQTVRDAILKAFPVLEEGDVRSTSMGAGGEDIQLSPAARKLFPMSVECKNMAKIALYKYYAQAKANSSTHEPICVIKQNRSLPLVLVDLEYFMRLCAKSATSN